MDASPTSVAKTARVHYTTAQRALTRGWPRRGFAPLVEVLRDEQDAARAERERKLRAAERAEQTRARTLAAAEAAETAKLRRLATRDVLRTKAEELELVRAERGALSVGLYIVARALRAARLWYYGGTDDDGNAHKPHPIDWGAMKSEAERIRALATLTQLAPALARAGNEIVTMERRVAGEPTEILDLTVHADVSIEEVEARQGQRRAIIEAIRGAARDVTTTTPVEDERKN